ncbi:hypothetical protein EV426DRAFT_539402 [Tirmania nivea]|nr:hypothetical protein EV426DRAFT_539402 [Tirmania nivea]
MTDDERIRKRSKWDEPEPHRESRRDRDEVGAEKDRYREDRERAAATRGSRWDDRRSRSPSHRDGASRSTRRSRSPPGVQRAEPDGAPKKPVVDPQAAAAAAAARIAASINARKGIQQVDVPPIKTGGSNSAPPNAPTGPGSAKSGSPGAVNTTTFNKEMYIADGDYIKDIEVNDLRNRYMLTKGATQKMIKEETGADVTTRGAYYPDKSMATPQNPPLYLHVTSTTKEGLEKAVAKIDELMKQDLPNLVDERRFRRPREPDPTIERDEFGRRKWPEEKIVVGLEPLPGFNLRASVVGHGGQYVKHIQQETRCRVQIKGRGSGFMEHGTGQESDEPLYLHVTGPDPVEVQNAKSLCEDLLTSVREQYEAHKSQPTPVRFPGYGGSSTPQSPYGGPRGGPGGAGGGGSGYRNNSHSASPPPPPPSGSPPTQPPPPPPMASLTAPGAPGAPGTGTASAPGTAAPGTQDYMAQYAQYYGAGGDPYAAYGGYQNYVAYYQYYMQQQAAAGAAPGAGAAAAPPPPPSGSPPPPPPPPGY